MGGPPPYGYEINGRKLTVNEEEAQWVRFIFEQYANRVPLIDVKYELDSKGVQPRRKRGTWTIGSLRAMLRNTHYLGYWDFKDGKTGEEIRVECPRILSAELWSKVQKTREENQSKRNSTNAVKHFYMLRNVLRCGHCGTWMSGVLNPKQPSKKHYYCPKKERIWAKQRTEPEDKWKRGRVCDMTRSLNIDATDELVWNTVIEVITNSKSFREKSKIEMLGKDHKSAKSAQDDLNGAKLKIKQLTKQLSKVEQALARIETDRLMERLSREQYPIVRNNIANEKIEIEAEIERLTAKIEGVGQQQRWIKWFDEFRLKMRSFKTFTPEQRKEVLMGLLTSIDVFMIDGHTHWLELKFNIPLVDDELVYRDPSKKKLGYAIKDGLTTFMVELTQKSHVQKKPYQP